MEGTPFLAYSSDNASVINIIMAKAAGRYEFIITHLMDSRETAIYFSLRIKSKASPISSTRKYFSSENFRFRTSVLQDSQL